MFRDAIVELFETELQERFSSRARGGLISVLNYVGGTEDLAHKRLHGRCIHLHSPRICQPHQGQLFLTLCLSLLFR